ncbi:MAG TPA: NUDIX hydrolase [Verrucomicrobiae bacterium]|nr:NUDIX hydrolase [Verrucomicrobiae bacterium]
MADLIEIAGVVARNDEGEYLLVQEMIPEAYGKWNLAAGHIDEAEGKRETPGQAALREGNEETGYVFELVEDEPILVDTEVRPGYKFYAFLASIIGGDLQPPEAEILDAKWFSYSAIKQLEQSGQMRSTWQFAAIEKAEAHAHSRN